MGLALKFEEIKTFLSVPDDEFDLDQIIDVNFDSDDLKLGVLEKVLTFIYNFAMFKQIRPFMMSVYKCVKNTLEIKTELVSDYEELLLKNAIMRFIQEYIDYAKISQKETVLNFLADSFERLGVQPLIINLGLLIKPMYADQDYVDEVVKMEEVEVVVSDDEITKTIKLTINNWLEKQKLDLEKEEELKGKVIEECEQLASEHKLSKESKTYNVLLTEVIEMLAMRLTMLSLMESVPDDLEPVPIK